MEATVGGESISACLKSKKHLSIVEDIVARYIFIFCGICLFLSAHSSIFAAFSPVFATSEECAFCHTSSATALIDSEGNDLSIADDWSSTMMANSFRDPLFRAKVESEMSRNPHLADVIEDKCLTCHTPMGRTQAIRDGGESYSLSDAGNSELAWDGVSCTLCHQIQGDNLGSKQSFSGNYLISKDRKIFGPYKQVFPNPMINHVNYLPVYGEQVDRPELCATCHTLFTPYVDEDGKIAGKFPEQTPFLEWLNSTYSSSDNYQSCQDCHMPRIDEPVKITNRPPWYQVRQTPFWKHHFIGGNKFVLTIMRDQREPLGIMVSEAQFERTIKRTAERLGREAAGISISRLEQRGNRLMVDVGVYNKTGHKFPTGFPSRRAWIRRSLGAEANRSTMRWRRAGSIGGSVGEVRSKGASVPARTRERTRACSSQALQPSSPEEPRDSAGPQPAAWPPTVPTSSSSTSTRKRARQWHRSSTGPSCRQTCATRPRSRRPSTRPSRWVRSAPS